VDVVMPKYQLTMSPGYVQDWTYLEAVRELFQNALDNQIVDTENEMFFDYHDGVHDITKIEQLTEYIKNTEAQLISNDTETNGISNDVVTLSMDGVLRIGNKSSILTLDTLLLGSSSKRDDENTVGKHGEGYKVALMVLLREGKQVTFYNYGARQVWKTRLVKSRRFNGALIPEIDIDKKFVWESVPSHNLIIEIKGITPVEYANIVNSNLNLQGDQEGYATENNMGRILTDPKYKGHMYVNGLFVCENKQFHYGYNIAPKYIKLDRDRKILDTIDLSFVTSKMWRYSGQEELVAKLLLNDMLDVKYIKDMRDYSITMKEADIDRKITENLKDQFIAVHGEKSIPVSDNKDLQRVSRSGTSLKPAMVSSGVSSYLKSSVEEYSVPHTSVKQRMKDWFKTVEHKLSAEEQDDFNVLLGDMGDE
jgi:hypothetical protein